MKSRISTIIMAVLLGIIILPAGFAFATVEVTPTPNPIICAANLRTSTYDGQNVVTWSTSVTGKKLQVTHNIGDEANAVWSDFEGTPQVVGSCNVVPAQNGADYRLADVVVVTPTPTPTPNPIICADNLRASTYDGQNVVTWSTSVTDKKLQVTHNIGDEANAIWSDFEGTPQVVGSCNVVPAENGADYRLVDVVVDGGGNGGEQILTDNSHNTGGGSSGGSRQPRLSTVSPEPLAASNLDLGPTSCVYLTQYLKFGGDNNPAEVRKLQLFLKNSENLDVDVNNIFDLKTLKAVEAFQAKYLGDVMGPWGATIPSGQVYISTSKKINELNCKNPLTFTREDLAIFAKYRSQKTLGITGEGDTSGSSVVGVAGKGTDDSSLTLNEGGQKIDENGNVASASVGFGARIGNFFKAIFKFLFRK